MSHFQAGTMAGDHAIAEALGEAIDAGIDKQLEHRLAAITYAPVIAVDAATHRVTVDLQGRSDARVELDVVGLLPAERGQAQVFQLYGGRSFAVAVEPSALGLGDVDLSSLATTVMLDEHARSNEHLPRWNTLNTRDLYANQWTLIASGEMEERFGHLSAVITISGAGPNVTWTRGTLWLHVAQPTAFPSAPVTTLELEKGRDILPADIVLRIVTGAESTVWELYARVTRAWELMIFRVLLEDSHYDAHRWGCSPFLTAIPTGGTQITSVAI